MLSDKVLLIDKFERYRPFSLIKITEKLLLV